MKRKLLYTGVLALALLGNSHGLFAQETVGEQQTSQVVIQPLFEYPIAPEELEGLSEKTDYLMKNFWNPMDFKNTNPVDQHALNDAFETYCSFMPHANEKVVITSVDDLISKIKNNPTLTLQFTKAAEEVLYGPRSRMWIDQIYVKFLENLVSNKKIEDIRKAKYKDQLDILSGSMIGADAYRFGYVTLDGTRKQFNPKAKFTLIEFGNPDCDDCKFAKLRMDISSVLNELISQKKLEVYFIIADSQDDGTLLKMTKDYPSKWEMGQSADAEDHYDLRATPAMYIIGQDGKIIAKNVPVDTAIGIIEELSKQ